MAEWAEGYEAARIVDAEITSMLKFFSSLKLLQAELGTRAMAAYEVLAPLQNQVDQLTQAVTDRQAALARLEQSIADQRITTTQQVEALRNHQQAERVRLTDAMQAMQAQHDEQMATHQAALTLAQQQHQAQLDRLATELAAKRREHDRVMQALTEAEGAARTRLAQAETRLTELATMLTGGKA